MVSFGSQEESDRQREVERRRAVLTMVIALIESGSLSVTYQESDATWLISPPISLFVDLAAEAIDEIWDGSCGPDEDLL